MSQRAGMVIVGGGLAGAKAAQALRGQGYDGPVALIGDEPLRPCQRPPLSKEYLQGKAAGDVLFVHPEAWYRTHGVDLRLSTPASAIDRDLRRVEGSARTRAAPRSAARVVVVGAGWIGLEAAAAARVAGAQVTLVESAQLPLLHALGTEIARVFAAVHRAHRVDLRLGVEVAEIAGTGHGAAKVHLTDRAVLDADAVTVGIGAAPDTALAVGLMVEDGVVADASLQTGDPDIYAAGDVAHALHPLHARHIRVEHWPPRYQSAVAARAMLGDGAAVYDRVPIFYSAQYELAMEVSGYIEPSGYDTVIVRGNPHRSRTGSSRFISAWTGGHERQRPPHR
ncbi:MAG TPA: FAD-dependent oxidoreductase [Actinocrinis sp.]|nr:FAD-dependent oxidoreductase [Actinocrinis sp.]